MVICSVDFLCYGGNVGLMGMKEELGNDSIYLTYLVDIIFFLDTLSRAVVLKSPGIRQGHGRGLIFTRNFP